MADDLFSNLPEDILLDILSRLPLKTISSCKWVNKTWLNLVHHPRLAEIHYSRAIQSRCSPCLFFSSTANTSYLIPGESFDNSELLATPHSIKFHELGNPAHCQMVGCVNGLICFSCHNKYYVGNPVTGECTLLPHPPSDIELVAFGFGFDCSSNDYKVVRILRQKSKNGNKIEVYTLGSSSWREMETNAPYVASTVLCNVLLNGCVHWIARKSYTWFSVVILVFNVASEVFSVIELPLILNWSVIGFKELGGRLCVILGAIFGDREIWVMKDYGDEDSWDNDCVVENIHDIVLGALQLTELGNGLLLLLNDDQELGYYDPQEGTFSRIEVCSFGRRLGCTELPIFLMGSLFSPKKLGYH